MIFLNRFSESEKKIIDKLNSEIITSDKNGRYPYVFISYKSDDRLIMLKIVHRLNSVYGLRVYYDKEFAVNNELWVEQMEDNMSSAKCYGMVSFISKRYFMSYAACMEMMHSQTSRCFMKRRKHENEYLPIVPVNLDPWPIFSDDELDRDTGLQHDNVNLNAEKEAFINYYDELSRRMGLNYYRTSKRSCRFSVKDCESIIKSIYDFANVNENRYYESTFESFCNTLAENIHNSVYKLDENGRINSVFDEEKYQRAINSFHSDTGASEDSRIVKAVEESDDKSDVSSFWSDFMEYAFGDGEFGDEFRRRNPSKDRTMNFSIGTSRCRITAYRGKKMLSCGIQIPDDKGFFNDLYAQKKDIESQIGSSVSWRSEDSRKSSCIEVSHTFDTEDDNDKQFEWLKDTMLSMKRAIKKYL